MEPQGMRLLSGHLPTEARGANDWCTLARLVISVQHAHPEGQPKIALEGYASRSRLLAPWALEIRDADVARWLAGQLVVAAQSLDRAQAVQRAALKAQGVSHG